MRIYCGIAGRAGAYILEAGFVYTEEMMPEATVSAKGWVVIPKEIRDKLGLKKGSKVHMIEIEGMICMEPVFPDVISRSAGMFAGGPSLTEEYLREKRQEEAERDAKLDRYFPSKRNELAIRETNDE
jgi:AbrB family looped-hinge helix DNA binding protein